MENENPDIAIIKKKDGKRYTVRRDRSRYFFPVEWKIFIDSFKNKKHHLLFLTLLHTGARIMEALHLKVKSFDFHRGTVTFKVIKTRTSKKKTFSSRKKREFFVTEKYLREIKAFINKNNLKEEEYLFLNKKDLPINYETLSNKEKLKYFNKTKVAYSLLMKRHLKIANINNYYEFSLHNIRKTYGNWMRLFLKIDEICYRMGHDEDTFMEHYGSSLLFDENDKVKIKSILGEVK